MSLTNLPCSSCRACKAQTLWRGGLSERRIEPFGCEAVVKTARVFYLPQRDHQVRAASRPNGGKPPRHRCRSERCGVAQEMLRGSQKNIVTQKIVRPMQNHLNRRNRRCAACAANAGRGMPHWRHSMSCGGLVCWQYRQTGMALTRTVPGASDQEWRSDGRPE